MRRSVLGFLYTISGDAVANGDLDEGWDGHFPLGETFSQQLIVPGSLPPWLTEADVDFYVDEITRTGFRGGLNWYRNINQIPAALAPWVGATIEQPAFYMGGTTDLICGNTPDAHRCHGGRTSGSASHRADRGGRPLAPAGTPPGGQSGTGCLPRRAHTGLVPAARSRSDLFLHQVEHRATHLADRALVRRTGPASTRVPPRRRRPVRGRRRRGPPRRCSRRRPRRGAW